MSELVSVVVPTRNRVRLLRRTIASVLAQHGVDLEVVVLTAARIGQSLTGTPMARELADRARSEGDPPMTADEVAALADAGMEIGFHTIDHDVLSELGESTLGTAVTIGREELAAAAGVPIAPFAYPPGRSDERAAAAVGRAGYRSAWTTAKHTARPSDPPMLRGRWDVGHRPLIEMRRMLVRGLARSTP